MSIQGLVACSRLVAPSLGLNAPVKHLYSALIANLQSMSLMVWGLFMRRYRLCSTMEIPIKVGISETLFFYLQFLILKNVEIS